MFVNILAFPESQIVPCNGPFPLDTMNVQGRGDGNKYAILFDQGEQIILQRMEQVS